MSDCFALYVILTLSGASSTVKPEILKLKDTRGQTGSVDCKIFSFAVVFGLSLTQLSTAVNYSEYGQLPSGTVNLIGRVK